MRESMAVPRGASAPNVLTFVYRPVPRAQLPRGPAAIVPLRPRGRARTRERWVAVAWWSGVLVAVFLYLFILAW